MTLQTTARLAFLSLLLAGCGGGGTAPSGGGPDGGPDAGLGTPSAQFSAAAINFGGASCGGAAPAPFSLALANTGDAPLTYATALSTGAFSVASGGSGSVPAGGSANIVLAASAVPATQAAGAVTSASLTLTTNDPAHASSTIALSVTAQGGALTVSPAAPTFPLTPVGVPAAALPITLTNSGNAPVSVSLGGITNADFGAVYAESPAAVTVAAGATLPGLQATFRPTRIGPESSVVYLIVTGPVCAGSANQLAVTGQGASGVFTSSSSDLRFGPNGDGLVPCGTQAAPQYVTITNTGNQAFNWTAALGSAASSFSATPLSGVLGATLSQRITVTPKDPVPALSATTAELYSDTLTFTTDIAADAAHVVNLHETAYGAIVTVPSALDFGGAPINSVNNSVTLTIVNGGNAAAHVASLISSDPTVFAPAPLPAPTTITSASPLAEPVFFKPGATPATHSATLTLSLNSADVLCAPLPTTTTLTGVGLGGAVSFDKSSLDYGQVNCGSTAPAQTITFSNPGNQAYTITTSLNRGASSPYLVSTCQGGAVAANGGTCAVTVTPQAIPGTSAVTPNLYGDLLTVTTNVAGDSPHYFPLKLTAQGAIVGLERSSIDFGSVFAGSAVKYVYGVTNTGNQPVSLDLTQTGPNAIFNLPIIDVAAHDARSASILFTPQAAGSTYSAIATVAPHGGQVLCKPLPFTSITLFGAGGGTNLDLPASLEFAPLPCGGSGTGAPQTFSVNNPTSAPFKVTAVLGKTGSAALFTVSPVGQQTVAAQQKVTYTLTPLAIPATAPTQLHAIADVLTFTTTVAGDFPHPVYLQGTAQGAVVSFSEATVALPPTPTGFATTVNGGFYLVNDGNAPISMGLTLSDTADFALYPLSFNVGQFSPVLVTATFAPSSPGMKSGSVAASLVPGATGLCQPLPGAITLTGTGQ